jgi:Flp pilus assembly protein TadG
VNPWMMALCALVLPVLLIACGLAIDLGLMESHALTMQQAADAAAASAELELERGTGNWVTVGKATAALNGFTDGQGSVQVVVSMAPGTGAFAGQHDAVKVAITDEVATIFLRVADEQASVVTASAVALAPPCFYLTGGKTAVTSQGSVLTLNCPFYANRGVALDANSSLAALAENLTGSAAESTGIHMTPVARFNAATVADPLAALSEPAAGSCAHTSYKQSGGAVTLSPGTYCKGMTLINATVTLQPGQYLITGGAHWSGSTVQGTGVTLFFTKGTGAAVGQFVVDGNSRLTLSAPPSGTALAGVIVFGTRNWTATATQDFQLINSTVHADGIWYLPGSGLLLNGSTMDCDHYLGLEAKTLALNSSRLTGAGDFSRVATGSPFRPLGGLVQ